LKTQRAFGDLDLACQQSPNRTIIVRRRHPAAGRLRHHLLIFNFSRLFRHPLFKRHIFTLVAKAKKQYPLLPAHKPSHPIQNKCKQASVSVFISIFMPRVSVHLQAPRLSSIVLFRMLVWFGHWSIWRRVFGTAYAELFRMTVTLIFDCTA
jgi:hypothetical protein